MHPVQAPSDATRQRLPREKADKQREERGATPAVVPAAPRDRAHHEDDDGYADLPCTD
jgi:hypothetical protein